jgi:hypothetical protein
MSSPDLKNKYNDETLPNFIKRKHPRKGEKKKQGARTKVQASKHPKEPGHKEVMEPLTETSNNNYPIIVLFC